MLCEKAGQVVTMAEVAEGLSRLGHLPKRPVTPDARDLRYKILRAFKRVFAGLVPVEELNQLIESIPGVVPRLNLAGGAQVLDE